MNELQMKRFVELGYDFHISERPFASGEVFSVECMRSGKNRVIQVAPDEVTSESWSFEATDTSGGKWVVLVVSTGVKLFWETTDDTLGRGHYFVGFDEIQAVQPPNQ